MPDSSAARGHKMSDGSVRCSGDGRRMRDTPSTASVDWEQLAHHFADELVERWHRPDSAHALPLAQFMGLSDDQWAAWVERRYDDVFVGGDDA